jgi:hypothetical protein
MLDAFYAAFSPACFALLGLWLVIVQMRQREWQGSAVHNRRSYGVALHFALPGVMSMFALIDSQDPAYWRVSFAIVALGGAVVMVAVRGYLVPAEPTEESAPRGVQGPAVQDQLGLAAFVAAIVLYVAIGVLAVIGGLQILRTEATLLTILVFLGFNVAWLLMSDDRSPAGPAGEPAESEAG